MNRLAAIWSSRALLLRACLTGLLFAWTFDLSAAQPRFTGIDLLSPKLLVLHFDTEPNRAYIVQVSSSADAATHTVVWRDFYVVPALPFQSHYVVPDSITNRQRFYRLLARP